MLTELILNPGNIIAGSFLGQAVVKFGLKTFTTLLIAAGANGPDEVIGGGVALVAVVGEIGAGIYFAHKMGQVEADTKITASMTDAINTSVNFMQKYSPDLAEKIRQKEPKLIQAVVGLTNKIDQFI